MHELADELLERDDTGGAAPPPVPPRPHTVTSRVTLRTWDADLKVEKIRGVGFRALCTGCGKGPSRSDRTLAVADKRAHDRYHDQHGPAPAPAGVWPWSAGETP